MVSREPVVEWAFEVRVRRAWHALVVPKCQTPIRILQAILLTASTQESVIMQSSVKNNYEGEVLSMSIEKEQNPISITSVSCVDRERR